MTDCGKGLASPYWPHERERVQAAPRMGKPAVNAGPQKTPEPTGFRALSARIDLTETP